VPEANGESVDAAFVDQGYTGDIVESAAASHEVYL
jgi:hypothetical protein